MNSLNKCILEKVNKRKWYHKFEILPGIITPGVCPVNAKHIFDFRYKLEEDLTGKKILEIGTWDGPYAFELERRGALVTAIDIHDPDVTSFNTAKEILKSKVNYIRSSIYNIPEEFRGQFDIVIFFGVFYHLKHPLLAFEKINSLLKEGGTLLFEGECFTHYAETLNNNKIGNKILMSLIAMSDIPITLSYPGKFKKLPNWFIPNLSCLKGWLLASGFEVKEIRSLLHLAIKPIGKLSLFNRVKRFINHLFKNESQRAWGKAIKVRNDAVLEHRIIG